jgi:hypothetical protein
MKGMYKKLKEQVLANEQKHLLEMENKLSPEEIKIAKLLEEIGETVRGGLADTHTPESIAKLHGVNVKEIEKQIEIGKKVEMEHTNDPEEARLTAMDHLVEIPDYYDRLEKMEKQAEQELKEYYKMYEEILAEQKLPNDPEYALPEKKKYPLFSKPNVLMAIRTFNLIEEVDQRKAAREIIKKMRVHGIRKGNINEGNKLLKYVKDTDLI